MGADLDIVDLGGNTPLILAAFGGHKEVVKLLLKNHARTDITNRSDVVREKHACAMCFPTTLLASTSATSSLFAAVSVYICSFQRMVYDSVGTLSVERNKLCVSCNGGFGVCINE